MEYFNKDKFIENIKKYLSKDNILIYDECDFRFPCKQYNGMSQYAINIIELYKKMNINTIYGKIAKQKDEVKDKMEDYNIANSMYGKILTKQNIFEQKTGFKINNYYKLQNNFHNYSGITTTMILKCIYISHCNKQDDTYYKVYFETTNNGVKFKPFIKIRFGDQIEDFEDITQQIGRTERVINEISSENLKFDKLMKQAGKFDIKIKNILQDMLLSPDKYKVCKKFEIGHKYILRPDYVFSIEHNNTTYLGRKTYWTNELRTYIKKDKIFTIKDIGENSNKDSKYSIIRIKENDNYHNYYLHPEDFIDVTKYAINEKQIPCYTFRKLLEFCKFSIIKHQIIRDILEFNTNKIEDKSYDGGRLFDFNEYYKQGQNKFNYLKLYQDLGVEYHEENLDNFYNDIKELHNMEDKQKMEMKNFNKGNLEEAKKQYEMEKANEEIEYAKRQLANANDNILRLDRQIKSLEEQKEPYLEILKMFDTDKSKTDKKSE